MYGQGGRSSQARNALDNLIEFMVHCPDNDNGCVISLAPGFILRWSRRIGRGVLILPKLGPFFFKLMKDKNSLIKLLARTMSLYLFNFM
jgi:hypothetical protein